jgi:hypothetical protein
MRSAIFFNVYAAKPMFSINLENAKLGSTPVALTTSKFGFALETLNGIRCFGVNHGFGSGLVTSWENGSKHRRTRTGTRTTERGTEGDGILGAGVAFTGLG